MPPENSTKDEMHMLCSQDLSLLFVLSPC